MADSDFYEFSLPCGHNVVSTIGKRVKCGKPCGKIMLKCNHGCSRVCHVDDDDHQCESCGVQGNIVMKKSTTECQETVVNNMEVTFQLPCGHEILAVKGLMIPVCTFQCLQGLPCGHQCSKTCHYQAEQHQCVNFCQGKHCGHLCALPQPHCKSLCPPCIVRMTERYLGCHHEYTYKCGDEENPRICQFICDQELSCGHRCPFPCRDHETSGESRACPPCNERVPGEKIHGSCGHTYKAYVPCHVKETSAPVYSYGEVCAELCEIQMSCGHKCKAKCSDCVTRSHHDRCIEPCDKTLPCGHKCKRPCPSNCDICDEDCQDCCEHRKCDQRCGVPCSPCSDQCAYQCRHLKCTRLCNEPCDRPPCDTRCDKVLPCMHQCVGYCGEPCPPLCRLCNDYDLGLLVSKNVTSKDRFIYSTHCGHTIASDYLNKITAAGGPRECPVCNTTMAVKRRCFKTRVNVLFQAWGNESQNETLIVEHLRKSLRFLSAFKYGETGEFKTFKRYTRSFIELDDEENVQKMLSLKESESLLLLSWTYDFLLSKWKTLEGETPSIPDDHLQTFLQRATSLLQVLRSRGIPLQEQEVHDSVQELRRIEDMCILFRITPTSNNDAIKMTSSTFQDGFHSILQQLLLKDGRYTHEQHGQVFKLLRELNSDNDCILKLSGRIRIPLTLSPEI